MNVRKDPQGVEGRTLPATAKHFTGLGHHTKVGKFDWKRFAKLCTPAPYEGTGTGAIEHPLS